MKLINGERTHHFPCWLTILTILKPRRMSLRSRGEAEKLSEDCGRRGRHGEEGEDRFGSRSTPNVELTSSFRPTPSLFSLHFFKKLSIVQTGSSKEVHLPVSALSPWAQLREETKRGMTERRRAHASRLLPSSLLPQIFRQRSSWESRISTSRHRIYQT